MDPNQLAIDRLQINKKLLKNIKESVNAIEKENEFLINQIRETPVEDFQTRWGVMKVEIESMLANRLRLYKQKIPLVSECKINVRGDESAHEDHQQWEWEIILPKETNGGPHYKGFTITNSSIYFIPKQDAKFLIYLAEKDLIQQIYF